MKQKNAITGHRLIFFSLLLASMCVLILSDMWLAKPLDALSHHIAAIRPVPGILFTWSRVCDFYRAAAVRALSLFVPVWVSSFSS